MYGKINSNGNFRYHDFYLRFNNIFITHISTISNSSYENVNDTVKISSIGVVRSYNFTHRTGGVIHLEISHSYKVIGDIRLETGRNIPFLSDTKQ